MIKYRITKYSSMNGGDVFVIETNQLYGFKGIQDGWYVARLFMPDCRYQFPTKREAIEAVTSVLDGKIDPEIKSEVVWESQILD